MRVVVKQNFSHELADLMIRHLKACVETLEKISKLNGIETTTKGAPSKSFRSAMNVLKANKKFLHSHTKDNQKGGVTRGVC